MWVWGGDLRLTCADADYHVAWSICRRPHRNMLSLAICACARVSSDCMAWWNAAGNTCKWTHTLDASCDGNPTGSHRCRFALQQTFWQTIYFPSFFALCLIFYLVAFAYVRQTRARSILTQSVGEVWELLLMLYLLLLYWVWRRRWRRRRYRCRCQYWLWCAFQQLSQSHFALSLHSISRWP